MTVIHILMDEPKFFHRIREIFTQPSLVNTWKVFNDSGTNSTWSTNNVDVHLFQDINSSAAQSLLIEEITDHDICFFHYFDIRYIPLFLEVHHKICTILQFWGGDYSPHIISPTRLYSKKTYAHCIQPFSKTKNWPTPFARLYHYMKWKVNKSRTEYSSTIRSAFHCGFELKTTEVEYFQIPVRSRSTLTIPYSIDLNQHQTFSIKQINDPGILLGNSATSTNCHIEAIDALQKHQENYKFVLIPLSYGELNVQQKIADYALKTLGKKALPLHEFMPSKDYFALLDNCEYIIMNHIRQQGLGNTLWGIANGRTIYLNPRGVTFQALTQYGFKIQSVDSILTQGLRTLNPQEKNINRELLNSYYPNLNNLSSQLEELINQWRDQ